MICQVEERSGVLLLSHPTFREVRQEGVFQNPLCIIHTG